MAKGVSPINSLSHNASKRMHQQGLVPRIHDMIISTNGIALFDYNGITPDQDQKVREYAKQIGIKYHVHKNSLFLAAIKETKFENLSDVIANNKLFSVIYFDNMKQLKDFINFVDSMNIPNGRNESRVFAHMYIE